MKLSLNPREMVDFTMSSYFIHLIISDFTKVRLVSGKTRDTKITRRVDYKY